MTVISKSGDSAVVDVESTDKTDPNDSKDSSDKENGDGNNCDKIENGSSTEDNLKSNEICASPETTPTAKNGSTKVDCNKGVLEFWVIHVF